LGRSIYCSACKKEKEPGRDNESKCKSCKSEANKALRAKRRAEKGLPPLGSGRSKNCYDCGAVKENRKEGYCRACSRRRDNEWRISTGRTKKHQTGLCPCGAERAYYNPAYCVTCATKQKLSWLNANPESKKAMQRKAQDRAKANYVSKSKGRIRRKGTLINGEPVLCSECDALSSGWCETCDLIYWWRKAQYEQDIMYAHKVKTRALTRAHIRSGKLIKQCCEVCLTEKNVQAHHDDYNKPLDVRWLCIKHHAEHHRNNP